MLGIRNPLFFPRLIRTGEVKFKAWSDTAKTTTTYELDWSESEKKKEEGYYKWYSGYASTDNQANEFMYIPELPKKHDDWLKNFTIAIPAHYLETIRSFSRRGLDVWIGRYPFDTMIREICLKPAIAYIDVAFRLIADCLYDPSTKYFYRGADKILFAHIALYKFWSGQTGGGLLERNADFDRLESMIKVTTCLEQDLKTHKIIKEFLDDMRDHRNNKEVQHSNIQTERNPVVSHPVVGPSLGEEKE